MKHEVLHNASLSDLSSIVLFLNKSRKTVIKTQLIFELIRDLIIPAFEWRPQCSREGAGIGRGSRSWCWRWDQAWHALSGATLGYCRLCAGSCPCRRGLAPRPRWSGKMCRNIVSFELGRKVFVRSFCCCLIIYFECEFFQK